MAGGAGDEAGTRQGGCAAGAPELGAWRKRQRNAFAHQRPGHIQRPRIIKYWPKLLRQLLALVHCSKADALLAHPGLAMPPGGLDRDTLLLTSDQVQQKLTFQVDKLRDRLTFFSSKGYVDGFVGELTSAKRL